MLKWPGDNDPTWPCVLRPVIALTAGTLTHARSCTEYSSIHLQVEILYILHLADNEAADYPS